MRRISIAILTAVSAFSLLFGGVVVGAVSTVSAESSPAPTPNPDNLIW